MELSGKQLAAISGAIFGAVVALNFVQQWRSNEQFKTNFALLDFNGLRDKLMRQEMMEEIIPPEFNEADIPQEAPTEGD